MKITKSINGHCPHLDSRTSIQVDFEYVPVLNQTEDSYLKGSYSCDYNDNCDFDKRNSCPIYDSIPKVSTL